MPDVAIGFPNMAIARGGSVRDDRQGQCQDETGNAS